MNTTLETEVQTISRQLYAILVVKLEGKSLGIVQLVNKGEGLEAWRQLKLECEGKSGNRQAALLRGILNPRAAWEADTRDCRSVVESLNRWEKTIGFCQTASGVDISDGILAATVLEHSPESYQPLPMCEHHTAQCVAGYVSMRRRCGGMDGTSGSSSHQTPTYFTGADGCRSDPCSVWILVWQRRERERARARWQRQGQERRQEQGSEADMET